MTAHWLLPLAAAHAGAPPELRRCAPAAVDRVLLSRARLLLVAQAAGV